MNNMDTVKPVIKWVGGKTQILDKILSKFPSHMNSYHEPFVGGGSVLFALLTSVYEGNIKVDGDIYASDKNPNLIYMYQNIQKKPSELIDELNELTNEFSKLNFNNNKPNRKPQNKEEALECQESYYYWIRKVFNSFSDIERMYCKATAYFIFLNKTCFRGVYREGPNGFNVPFGHYKNPSIYDEDHILITSSLLQNVTFKIQSFEESFNNIQECDFVYLDPPYAPENSTSFVGYTKDGFDTTFHTNLFNLCSTLTNVPNVQFIMSNSNVDFVKKHFNHAKYSISTLSCKRTINSKNPSAKAEEILIIYK
jgi:DNA adenine methylase